MNQAEPLSLTARLRHSIAAEHEAIERTPFSVALMSGRLGRETYVINLAQMHRIHTVFESLCGSQPELTPYFHDAMRRADVIAGDVAQLGFDLTAIETLPETERIVSSIEDHHARRPLSLLGGIYILEGSRMGSLVLAKPLAKCLQVSGMPGTGIDYHVDGARETPARLKQWKHEVDQAGFDEATADDIAAFAVVFMRGLLELYAAIPAPETANRSVA
jgi:heme oxygenase